MDPQTGLGIYIGKNRAVVVCLKNGRILSGFSVQADNDQESPLQAVARAVGQECKERNLRFSDVSVALDSSLFMQHSIHSEFSNIRQIAQTIRFDTEEVVATDISKLAVGFDLCRSTESGSDVNVFTAEHAVLSDIVLTLQGYGIDPVNIVPDVSSLARMIPLCADQPNLEARTCIYAVLSEKNGYFLESSDAENLLPVRAFYAGKTKNKTDLLVRETSATMALCTSSADTLVVLNSGGEVDLGILGSRLTMETLQVDWLERSTAGIHAQQTAEDPIDYAIAYGATLFNGDKSHSLSFRNDFMPHQGRNLRQRSAVKWICISMTVLFLALGGHLQAKWYAKNKDAQAVHARLAQNFSKVMHGRKLREHANCVYLLKKEKRKITDLKSGRISLSNQSTAVKLQLILQAINNCYKRAGLNIKKIAITKNKTVAISGSASSPSGRNFFLEELKKTGLGMPSPTFSDVKSGRYPFSITIKTKKTRTKAK